MRDITPSLSPELSKHLGKTPVARGDALLIDSFGGLVKAVAQLSYLNKDHLLFFRGQPQDFRNKAEASTIYPSIYRGERVSRDQLELSFAILDSASARLCDCLKSAKISEHREVRKRRYIQWSILQHYEVCATPLLDLTHSLRVACSFAFNFENGGEPYVFVFGLPYITNRVSINSEHDLVNIRLLSICPPDALRPYFQEGYVAGTDEISTNFDSKSELDFNRRLIAKFRLHHDSRRFWEGGFEPYSKDVLFPKKDKVRDLCIEIKKDMDTDSSAESSGAFLNYWTVLEARLMHAARSASTRRRIYSLLSALEFLKEKEAMSTEIYTRLYNMQKLRNTIVRNPSKVTTGEVARAKQELKVLLDERGLLQRK